MDTEQAIETDSVETQETPEIATQDDANGGGDGGAGDGASLPMPSIGKKHLALVALVVAAVVAWKLYSRESGRSSGESLRAAAEADPAAEATTADEDGEITVAVDHDDPLAGDESVAEEFRSRGILSEGE